MDLPLFIFYPGYSIKFRAKMNLSEKLYLFQMK